MAPQASLRNGYDRNNFIHHMQLCMTSMTILSSAFSADRYICEPLQLVYLQEMLSFTSMKTEIPAVHVEDRAKQLLRVVYTKYTTLP